MTKITYDDSRAGRFRLKVDGHAVRINPGDDHNVICACISSVVCGLLTAMPEHMLDETSDCADDSVTIETDGAYIRVEPGFAEFDLTVDDVDTEFFRGAFEHAVRSFEWIAREWPRQVRVEY
ncbi:MAG: ribosomal-processing cysteine protease Prp [Clostridia bacterium]|nr:ribosomal-processing cysteine protease Prp [Clostridia bacterium]